MNILLLTSCNRIKQVLLSLSINHEIIKNRFSVIILDNSTPHIVDSNLAQKIHDADDPYNVIKNYNYCSDVKLLYQAKKYLPKILDYHVIHCYPRLDKQKGDSTMVGLGIMQASLMKNYDQQEICCIKLTGTSILKFDIMPKINTGLKDFDIMTWHRSNIGGYERSTRIFACKPKKLVTHIANHGWDEWVNDRNGVFEQRFAKNIENDSSLKINYTQEDDGSVLLEGGMAMQQSYGREKILKFIEGSNINIEATPYLKEFIDGKIW